MLSCGRPVWQSSSERWPLARPPIVDRLAAEHAALVPLLERPLAIGEPCEVVVRPTGRVRFETNFRPFRLQGTSHVRYTALHRAEPERVGRAPNPIAAIMESQCVKTVEEAAGIQGYDAHPWMKGRKRHLGLPIASCVNPADKHDTGAHELLGGLACFVPRLKTIYEDAASRGAALAQWCQEGQQQGGGWDLGIVKREPEAASASRRANGSLSGVSQG